MHAVALQAAKSPLQIQCAGKSCLASAIQRMPLQLGFALHIGVAELQIGQLNRDALARHSPLRIARKLRQRYQRVVKKAGQIDCAVGDGNAGFAARLRHVKISRETANTGCRKVDRCNLKTHDSAAGLVLVAPAALALPARIQRFNNAFGRPGRDCCLRTLPQGQAVGDLR